MIGGYCKIQKYFNNIMCFQIVLIQAVNPLISVKFLDLQMEFPPVIPQEMN